MRITNQMMTNNSLSNIYRNKTNLNTAANQRATGMKIQRPSEDPIIAVRALRLRSSLSQLNQYYEKNIPDARSWMDVTESALNMVNGILTKMSEYCVQGSNGILTVEDRQSVVDNLISIKEQIYQEGNSNYAGRYVFTGYKTDSSLIFDADQEKLSYRINENFKGTDMESLSFISGSLMNENYTDGNITYNPPKLDNVHRIRLSYDKLADENSSGTDATPILKYTDANNVTQTPTINTVSLTDSDAYAVGADEVRFIAETGELLFGENVYKDMRYSDNISVEYTKDQFEKDDLKPEHYFNCVSTNSDITPPKEITYVKENQKIEYEINFNQKLAVNVQGSDAITHAIGRDIEEILRSVEDVQLIEAKIEDITKKLQDPSYTNNSDAKESLEDMLKKLETEKVLKEDIMQKKFEMTITKVAAHQEKISVAVSDLGSRYNRLDMTEDRLSMQQVDFEELMSNNENIGIEEAIINYNVMDAIYTSSLAAAAKVVKNTLLDFI